MGLTDSSSLERECEHLQAEQNAVSQQMNRMIRENAEVAQKQAEYNARLQSLEERYETLKTAMHRIQEAISEQTGRRRRLEAFMRELRESSLLIAFDERVFLGTVERITVFKRAIKEEKRLIFRFKNGWNVTVRSFLKRRMVLLAGTQATKNSPQVKQATWKELVAWLVEFSHVKKLSQNYGICDND